MMVMIMMIAPRLDCRAEEIDWLMMTMRRRRISKLAEAEGRPHLDTCEGVGDQSAEVWGQGRRQIRRQRLGSGGRCRSCCPLGTALHPRVDGTPLRLLLLLPPWVGQPLLLLLLLLGATGLHWALLLVPWLLPLPAHLPLRRHQVAWRLLRLLLSLSGPRHHGEVLLLLLSRLHCRVLRWRPLTKRRHRGALLRELLLLLLLLLSGRHHPVVLLLSRMLLLVHHHLLRPLLVHHRHLLLPGLHCHVLRPLPDRRQWGTLRELLLLLLLARCRHHRIGTLLLLLLLLLPSIHQRLLLPGPRHHPGSRNVQPLPWRLRLRLLAPYQWRHLLLELVGDLPPWAHHGAPLDLLLLLLLLLPWWSPRLLLLLLVWPPRGPGRRGGRKGAPHLPHHRAPTSRRGGASLLLLPGHACSSAPGPSLLLLLLLLLPSCSLVRRHLLTGRPRPQDVPVPDRARVLAPSGGLPP